MLDGYTQASKRVDSELEKERLKQEAELEKILKNRRGQKRAQIEKDKADAIKSAQALFDEETARERKQVEELKTMIKCEEGGNAAIEAQVQKLKQATSQ